MKKYAFTLAEVLITLGIIGVVAALTMPSVINDIRDREILANFKKSYSVLSQATQLATRDNPTSGWTTTSGSLPAAQEIYEYYKPYLNIVQDCGCGTTAPGCWSKQPAKALNGNTYTYGHAGGIGSTYCAFRLNGGINVSLDTWTASTLGVNSAINNNVFFFYVDMNGDKPPNTLGLDIFQFVGTQDRDTLVPAGIDNNSANCSRSVASVTTSGLDCAAKVLNEGKIDY